MVSGFLHLAVVAVFVVQSLSFLGIYSNWCWYLTASVVPVYLKNTDIISMLILKWQMVTKSQWLYRITANRQSMITFFCPSWGKSEYHNTHGIHNVNIILKFLLISQSCQGGHDPK